VAGPYGEWGSRKYLIASCDQSLKRMGLDYVDIFYSHRFDPDTPLEETMMALDHIVAPGARSMPGFPATIRSARRKPPPSSRSSAPPA
jgi:L-glyceraldehyde 3-phosphate reductase